MISHNEVLRRPYYNVLQCATTGSREWKFGEDDNFIQVGYAMIEECVQPLSTVADSTYIHTVVCEVM